MAFLDELKKGITDVSEQIAKKSGEIVEVQKLKIKKSGLESDVKKCYTQMGQIYFLKMEESGIMDEDVEEYFQQIVEAKASIDEITEKINILSSDSVCAVCGEHISKTALFCSHCGAKIERPVEEPCEEACEDDFEEEVVEVEVVCDVEAEAAAAEACECGCGCEAAEEPAEAVEEVVEESKGCCCCGGSEE